MLLWRRDSLCRRNAEEEPQAPHEHPLYGARDAFVLCARGFGVSDGQTGTEASTPDRSGLCTPACLSGTEKRDEYRSLLA
eukprot:3608219-Prorocentrum_lima.AAC.1